MSIRARLLRRTLRWFINGEKAQTLEEQRRGLDRFSRFQYSRRVARRETTLGGVPTVDTTPKGVNPGVHILYFHGGGYAMGSPRTHAGLAAQLAIRAKATVHVIDYRLAPEHPYPAAIEDCTAAYLALVAEVDPDTVVLAGDSAGGGAVLATAVGLRDGGERLPACLYLLSPWTDLTRSGDSIVDKAGVDPMFGTEGASLITQMADWYRGDYDADHPGISPLFAKLTGLPPMLVQVGNDEILLSDSTRLVERAKAAGVETVLDVADDMWHVYQVLAPLMPEAIAALDQAVSFISERTTARITSAVG